MKTKVTIMGMGTMGKAIAQAISRSAKQFAVSGIKRGEKVEVSKIHQSDFIILSMKPQDAAEAILQIKKFLNQKTILISIMAGISIKKLQKLSDHKKMVRMMPNLGLSVGHGIAAWKAAGLSRAEIKRTKIFLNKITDNFEVKEEDTINKVTAVSGSGPAYFFLLAHALTMACSDLGLKKEESQKLVEKTLSASAALGKDEIHADLIKKIASKGGTTEAALKVFKKKNFEGVVRDAVFAAYKRAKELNK